MELELATIDDITNQLKRRYVGYVLVVENRPRTGNSTQTLTQVFYDGGDSLAYGLVHKAVDIIRVNPDNVERRRNETGE